MEAKLLVLLALVATTVAGPIALQDTDSCSTTCKPSKKFNFASQTAYVYDYRVDTTTSMAGASEDSARTTLQSRVNIEMVSPCEFVLTLDSTRLFNSDGTGNIKPSERESEFRRALEANDLRFSYQDGVVESVCTGYDEPAWVMNIKKGVLSSFQNSMDDLTKSQNTTETDVSGTCETEYEAVSSGYYTTSVKKSKNILSCVDRNSYDTFFQMVQYRIPSEIQSLPFLKTSHECTQDIENGGVLKSSQCTETHVYRPFANGQNGATTVIKQTLKYSTSRRGSNSGRMQMTTRDSLAFDHSATKMDEGQARRSVEQRLQAICQSTQNDIRPESPRQFSELVQAMRSLSDRDTGSIHTLLKTKTMCPSNNKAYKFYLDALPVTGTSASIKLMTSLLTGGEVTGLHAKAWLTSLAFIRTPTSEMLVNAKTLIDSETLRKDAILPVSSLLNNFCRATSSCEKDYALLSVMASLERHIGYSCDATGKNFERVLLALRGIGNAGHATRSVKMINRCLTNNYNPIEIRVAAAEAFRRMPCDAEDDELWNVFENDDLDSELRIASYLALARCPSDSTLGKMAGLLANEKNEQVGAFIFSHLANLKQTSDPHKQDIAKAVANLALDKEFDLNPLKYSRNYEASALINKINTGVTAESNLVWSSETQMPRSLSANLTVQLFGKSVNMLDFGGRLEGLEYLIKNLFGPYLQDTSKSRSKAEDVEGSIYGRIFGNEMLFLHSKITESPFKGMPSNWLEMVIALSKQHNYALTQSDQFIDVEMTVPTSSGLPIMITVNGTSTMDLVLNGKMDLRKIGSKPRSLDIDGEIKPSAAVEITGTMAVNAFVTKTGLRMRNVLHSSTAIKGRVQLDRGQLLNVELDTPQDQMDVFSASSQFYIMHKDLEQEQAMITENRKQFKVCSGDKLATITGMELCGEVSFPNASMKADSPYYPLTGPSSASLTLYKKDSHSGYKLFAKRAEDKESSFAQISFNTPGSRVNRAMLAEINLEYPKQEISATMMSPWKQAKFTGAVMNNRAIKSISGSLEIDKKDTYGLTTEVKVTKSKSRIQLNPMFELRRPDSDNVQLTGYVTLLTPYKALDVDLSVSGLSPLPYNVKGSIANSKKEKSISASYSSDGKTEYSILASNTINIMGSKSTIANLKSLFKVHTPQRKLVDMDASADYREGKSFKLDGSMDVHKLLKKPATFKVALLKSEKKNANRYDLDANVKSSSLTGSIDSYMLQKPSGFIASKASVDYTIPKMAKNKVILSGKWNVKKASSYKRYTLKSNLNVKRNPEYNLGLNMKLDHKKKNTGGSMELKYGANPKDKNKRIQLSTSLTRKIASWKQALVNFKASALAPEHNIDLKLIGKHQHNKKMLDSNVALNYGGKGKDVTAAMTIRNKSAKLMKVNGNMNLAWPGSEYTIKTDMTQKSPKQYDHVLNFKDATGKRHTVSTTYKTPKADGHSFSSNIRLAGMRPMNVAGSVTLDPNNFETSGQVQMGKQTYGLSTSTKLSRAPRAYANVELVYPARKIILVVDGGKAKGKYDANVEASWDADNDKSQKVVVGGTYNYKSAKDNANIGGSLSFSSPFKNFENIFTNAAYSSDVNRHGINGKLSWGGDDQLIVSSVDIMKPVSLNNLKLNAEAKTPFDGFKTAKLDVSHSYDGKVNTLIKGSLGKESGKLAISGEAKEDSVTGNIALRTSLNSVRSMALDVYHKSSNGRTASKSTLAFNKDKYGYDLNMDHSMNGWAITTIGDVTIIVPSRKIVSNWNHKNSDSDMKSTWTSEWAGKKFSVAVSGDHDFYNGNSMSAAVAVKSPWKMIQNVEASINHKMVPGSINSNAMYKQGGKTRASAALKYTRRNNVADAKFEITSPFSEDINGRINANYDRYPMAGSAQLQWSRKSKIDVEGSVDAENWEKAEAQLKVTTPFTGFRNVVLKGSNAKENNAMITHVNLDYGVKKNIDMESRFAYNDYNKLIRLKVMTPFSSVRSMDTGISFNGQSTNFDGSADFQLIPYVGKFQADLNMNYDDDLKGKLRIETPFADYPYFELSTTSMKNEGARNSLITAEYYPRQMFRLDTTYAFAVPLTFEASLNSPYPEYNDLSISIKHDHSSSNVVSHGEVTYQPNTKIEADVNADWSNAMVGSIVVKTPFNGYESNKISARHQGNTDAFSSRAEFDVAGQNVVADANYNGGYSSRAQLTFTSPIPGMENIELSMKKKGSSNNFKSGATFSLNGEKTEATLNHRLRSDLLKSSFSLSSPYTKDFKASIDHNGPLTSFNNKMSINYGRMYDVDTTVSFDWRAPDVTGNGMLKYKLGELRDVARVSFTKSGYSDDMSFGGTASVNKDDVSINGSWKSLAGYDGNVQIKTPFNGFRNVGLTMTHGDQADGFKSHLDVNYMDNQHIIGKMAAEMAGPEKMRLSTELHTPFQNLESTVVTLSNDYDAYGMSMNGQADVTTTIGNFGNAHITYNKAGGLDTLALDINAEMNGKPLTTLKVTNNMPSNEIHSQVDFNTALTSPLVLKLDHLGDWNNFRSQASAKYGTNLGSGEISLKQGYDDMDAEAKMSYNIAGVGRNSGSVTLHKDGNMYNFNTRASGKFGDDAVTVSLSKAGPIDDMNVRSLLTYNRDSISVEGNWKNQGSLEGSLQVKTPFTDYRNLAMKLSHTGELSDFSSSLSLDYMDNQNINGKMEMSVDSINRLRLSTEINTPFRNYEKTSLKINNDFDQNAMTLSGNAYLTTSMPEMRSASIQYSKTGILSNVIVEGKAIVDREQIVGLKLTNKLQDTSLNTALSLESAWNRKLILTLDHSGDLYNFYTNGRVLMGRNNVLSTEVALKTNGNTIDASGKATYYGSDEASITIHKEGEMDDVNGKVTGKYGGNEMTVSGALKLKDEISGSVNINTGLRGYKNIGMSFSHSGNMERFNTEAQMNYVDGEIYSTKVDFYRYLFRRIETTVELRSPIAGYEYTKYEYRHEGQVDSFKCYSTLEYSNSEKITYEMSAITAPKPEFSLQIKTPFDSYEDMLVSASYDNSWPTVSAAGKINAGNGNVITLKADFDASNDITGSIILSTPFQDFTDVGMSFQHSGTSTRFNSNGRITYMDGQEISGKATFKLPLKRMYVSAEMKTPFSGYEYTKYEHRVNMNKRESTASTSLVYGNGQVMSHELTVTSSPTPGFSLTVKTPVENYEEMMASGSLDVSGPKYELKSKVSAGRGKVITLNGGFDPSNDVTGYLILTTPLEGFTDVGVSFQHSGSDQKFESQGKMTYMDGKEISGKVSFYRYAWRRITASSELSTPFSGMERTKADVFYEDNSNSISATAALDYNNGEKMNGNLKFTYSPNYDMLITLNTPFYDYRMIRAQASLDTTSPSYAVTSSLNYGGYNNAFSANGKLNLYSASNVDGSVELTTPYDGMKYSKVDYKYKVQYPTADGSITLNYDNGQVISGEFKSTVSPSFDSSVVIKTPFRGYKTLKGSASFDSSDYKYDAAGSLTLGRDQVYSMTSGLIHSTEPIKFYTKISTPFDDWRNVEMTASHEGSLTNFKSTAFFSSPMTSNVNAKAELQYQSVNDMSMMASLKSALSEMDDLLVEVKRSDVGGEKKSQLVLGWTGEKKITADTVYRRQESWYETKVHSDMAVTSPFEGMRSMNLQIDHSGKSDAGDQKVQFDLNGYTLLDVDTVYSSKDKFEGSVTFTKPWAMQYTASGSNEGGVMDSNIYANWNRDEANSHVRLISSYSDKSDENNVDRELDVSMEYASRKMGIYHQMTGAGYTINSNGKIYWDEDDSSKLSYGLTLKDNSRRRQSMMDASLRFGLPSRTLQLAGSFSDNSVSNAMDATFSWDADRDDSKQVGVKTSMTRGDPIKGEVTLIMPVIRKEIRVSGEVMMKSGRVIFDGKTDISYSTDSRKTLTLTSRLEDISDYSSNYNYSLALGVKHPYTNVDISLNSHLGSSDEKYTLGMKAAYLTAKRQEKNVAVLAEINSLRRQMSLQVSNPMHEMEFVGDVVSTSPYKVRVMNRVDGEETFRSDVTVDSEEKSLLLNAFMADDTIAVSARYPNSSAFRAVVTHIVDGYSHQEALLALRLNTSRLLHTRLAWNTDLFGELREAVLKRLAVQGERITEDFKVINEAVAEELSAKYQVIAQSTISELKPLLDVLEREMSDVAIKMRELSGALRKMYENNDFYIQDMGVEVTEAYMALQERLATLNREYVTVYRTLINDLSTGMRQMAVYPLGQKYTEMVQETVAWMERSMANSLECFSDYLTRVDIALKEYRDSLKEMSRAAVDSMYNNTYVNYVSNQINTISPYVQSFQVPQQYTQAIYNVHDAVKTKLNSLMDVPEIRYIQGGVNEVYQQGMWAYNYWQVEENIHRHLQSILKTLKEIIEDELRENLEVNPITVWLPGEIQADLPLPVEVRRLDSLDELEMLYQRMESWLEKTMPDTEALDALMEKVSSYWPSNNTVETEIEKELKDFKPSRKMRQLRKRKRNRQRAYAQ